MGDSAVRSFSYEAEAFRSYCQRQFDSTLDYSFDAVALVDGILGEAHASLLGMNEAEAWTYLNNMTLAAGAFVGEMLVRTCGGIWTCHGTPGKLQDWGVQVTGEGKRGDWVPVYASVFNFLQRGPHETLLALVAPLLEANGRWPTPLVKTPPANRNPAKPDEARRLR